MRAIIRKLRMTLRKKKITKCIKSIGENCSFGTNCRVTGGDNITIGDCFSAEDNCILQTWKSYRGKATGYTPRLQIGNNVSIMSNCQISCVNQIEIGDGCLLGNNVFITDNFHGSSNLKELSVPPLERVLYSKGPVIIGRNVWVGRNVCIMPGVRIGDNCIVGANSVVTHSFPNNVIVAGVPAKQIKKD